MTQKEYKEKIIDKFVFKKYETNLYVQGRHLLYLIKPKNTESGDPRLLITYNVVDASQPTRLYFYYVGQEGGEPSALGVDMFDKVEIDRAEVSVSDLDAASGTYQLSAGEHTVAYTLKDPTIIGFVQIDESTVKAGAVFIECAAITNAEIPNGVTNIGQSAFFKCTSLKSVTIPSSVTSIGQTAFYNCSGLTSIDIPNSVTSIGGRAFQGCSGLTSVTIGNGVTTIGEYAFQGCTGLTSVTIPNSVTSIGGGAFDGCSSLTSVTIPDSVTSIGHFAFNRCSGLTSITSLRTTAPTIQSTTFQNVKSGGTLTVPSGSTGYDVWMGTSSYYLGYYGWDSNVPYICKLTLNNGNTVKLYGSVELTSVMMSDYKSTLVSAEIGNACTSIGYQAFQSCSALTSVTIPNSVTSIGYKAFDNTPWWNTYSADTSHQYGNIIYINDVAYKAVSTAITSCEFKNGTISISNRAFSGCSSLTSVTIPSSVTSIGYFAFCSCPLDAISKAAIKAINPNATECPAA